MVEAGGLYEGIKAAFLWTGGSVTRVIQLKRKIKNHLFDNFRSIWS